jgi:hypothetical protein
MIHITHLLVQFFHLSLQFLTSEIAITIILEHACLLFASKLNPTREKALDRACSEYKSSGIHHKVREQFSAPLIQHSIFLFTEFIIEHRL